VPRYEIILHEVLPDCPPYVLPLPWNVSLNVTSLWTCPACYWYNSQTVAHPSARVKADTWNTNLASSLRPLLVGHSYLF